MGSGGKREGAGRPAKAQKDKRVSLVMSVSQETRQWMRDMSAEMGVPMGKILETLIKSFEDLM